MDRIAEAAAINKAMLYYYFSSKDNLYREVLRSFFEPIFRGMAGGLVGDLSAEEKVRQLVSYLIDYYRVNSRFVRLLLREMADGGQVLLAVLGESKQAKQGVRPQLIIDFFEAGIRQGFFRPLDARHLIVSMIGMCLFMFIGQPILPLMLDIHPEKDETVRQRKKQVADLLLNGLLHHKRQE